MWRARVPGPSQHSATSPGERDTWPVSARVRNPPQHRPSKETPPPRALLKLLYGMCTRQFPLIPSGSTWFLLVRPAVSATALPGVGPARPLLGGLVLVFRQPLATDALHDGVSGTLRGLENLLHQGAGPRRLQLHRLQVGGAQLTALQVGLDLGERGWT